MRRLPTGAGPISSDAHAYRMNAAFRLVSERRIHAAAKNFVVRRLPTRLAVSP
jgi:hypothetical protein